MKHLVICIMSTLGISFQSSPMVPHKFTPRKFETNRFQSATNRFKQDQNRFKSQNVSQPTAVNIEAESCVSKEPQEPIAPAQPKVPLTLQEIELLRQQKMSYIAELASLTEKFTGNQISMEAAQQEKSRIEALLDALSEKYKAHLP